jgi:hypothetical protein
MVSRRLLGIWAFLDFLLLAAAVLTITLSFVWQEPNLIINMVFRKADITSGFALGIALLITFAISIAAIIQPNHVIIGLVILNWVLILDAMGIIAVGSFIWFYTLQERVNFQKVFSSLTTDQQISIQDHFQCCGYFSPADAVIGGSFCQNTTFVQTTINSTSNFCVTPITSFADMSLNNAFSTVYGYMAIVICLFLASLCVIKKRQETERFKKIDAKRGGKGFV